MANTGGGIIVFGVEDNGHPAELFESTHLLRLDLADLTNRVAKYTNVQFSDLEFVEVQRGARAHAALIVGEADVPIVFTKPGTYDVGGGKQKTAFSQGTVYFRHGAKSEPGNRDDLAKWRDREIERLRTQWMSGVRKVVEAPKGHTVTVTAPAEASGDAPTLQARISNDPNAPTFMPLNAEELWPWRQKNLLKAVNSSLAGKRPVIGHDIVCINRKFDVLKTRPDFAYKPHPLASPQYNAAYANWIVDQIRKDPEFIETCRAAYRNRSVPRETVRSSA